MKRWAAIIGVVGFLSAVVGLVQAFSFTHLETVRCSNANILDCVYDLRANVGKVVMLQWTTSVGDEMPGSNSTWNRRFPFERNVEEHSVSWQIETFTLAQQLCHQCSTFNWDETIPQIEQNFSERGLTMENLALPDNGISIRMQGLGQSANPYSTLELESEGGDRALGPFQISMSNRDANFILYVSPAPMTDALPREVRCSQRDWPMPVKFFVCPFA